MFDVTKPLYQQYARALEGFRKWYGSSQDAEGIEDVPKARQLRRRAGWRLGRGLCPLLRKFLYFCFV